MGGGELFKATCPVFANSHWFYVQATDGVGYSSVLPAARR
jgi:hypothetical protein